MSERKRKKYLNSNFHLMSQTRAMPRKVQFFRIKVRFKIDGTIGTDASGRGPGIGSYKILA